MLQFPDRMMLPAITKTRLMLRLLRKTVKVEILSRKMLAMLGALSVGLRMPMTSFQSQEIATKQCG
jgi:hypothetical protein